MRGRKTALVVLLTAEERDQLEQWERSTRTPVGRVRRATMVLHDPEGGGREPDLPCRPLRRTDGEARAQVDPPVPGEADRRLIGLTGARAKARFPPLG